MIILTLQTVKMNKATINFKYFNANRVIIKINTDLVLINKHL